MVGHDRVTRAVEDDFLTGIERHRLRHVADSAIIQPVEINKTPQRMRQRGRVIERGRVALGQGGAQRREQAPPPAEERRDHLAAAPPAVDHIIPGRDGDGARPFGPPQVGQPR